MKFLAVFVLGWVLICLPALAQEKVELNAITRVKVNGSTVEIAGSKKPNFTTFTMTDPPRLVIDISEAVLSGVPEELRVSGGLITGLRSANYGSDASAIARVLIGYDREVETDIQVMDNVLVVKVLEGGGPLVAQASTGAGTPVQAGTETTAAGAQVASAQGTQAGQQGGAAPDKATQEPARKAEEAERPSTAKSAEEERRARELAAAEAKQRQEALAREETEAKQRSEAEEKKRREEEARAAIEAKKQQEAEDRKRAADEAEERRLAALEEKKRKVEEARTAAETKRQQEAEERRLALLEEKRRKAGEAGDSRVASAEVPRRAEPVDTPSAPVAGRRRTLEIVGFQQQAGGARVYVRTNEPVSYKVSEGRNEIVLMLENTQIGKGNNTRALDTSFFDTAVARVDPTVGPDRSVRVSIKLKESVPVQTRQEGNTISLEFPRPGR